MGIWRRWVLQPQGLPLRKALFQIHLWTGITVGAYIFIVCLSGSVLVYRNELYTMFSPDPGGPLPVGFRLTRWLLDLHDNLLSGDTGRRINGIGALLVVLLCVTGACIWWPGIRSWRRGLTVEWRANWKRLTWSLHSALGLWFFAFILMWGITGTYLSFPTQLGALFDQIQPYDVNFEERLVDRVQYWLAYLHFGRLGGRGIPGCGRGWCDSTTKLMWAVSGLVPPVMFVTGSLMWWTRVTRPAKRRFTTAKVTSAPP